MTVTGDENQNKERINEKKNKITEKFRNGDTDLH